MTSIRPHTFLLIIAILFLFLTSGCQKSPINGDLDGQWQVMEVSPAHAETPIDARLYYCFYLHVCQLNYYGGTLTTGSMDYSGDHITLSFPTPPKRPPPASLNTASQPIPSPSPSTASTAKASYSAPPPPPSHSANSDFVTFYVNLPLCLLKEMTMIILSGRHQAWCSYLNFYFFNN